MKHRASQQETKCDSSFFENMVVISLIFAVIFYPLLLPLKIAVAEEISDSLTTQEDDSADDNKSETTSDKSEADTEKPSDNDIAEKVVALKEEPVQAEKKIPAPEPTPAITPQTPDISPDILATPQQIQSPTSPACPCSQPDESSADCCQKTTIENNNGVTIENDSDSISDTGNNLIKQDVSQTQSSEIEIPVQVENAEQAENISVENSEAQATIATKPAEESDDLANIQTGESLATNTIINQANTNIVSSNYTENIINIEGTQTEDINLLQQFQQLLDKQKENLPQFGLTSVENSNLAIINTLAGATANTGNNLIESEENSNALISTGNAIAQTNIVNIVNQNIVGNTWVFSVINVFGDWLGNLILPGEGLLTTSQDEMPSNLEVSNSNNSEISNKAVALAESGENTISNSTSASISTGSATSDSNVKTIANTNIVQNNWFFLLINNMGAWTGKTLGWNQNAQAFQEVYEYQFQADPMSQIASSFPSLLSVFNDNNADISNTAVSISTTGENSVQNGEQANIKSGDAYAKSDIFNLINTNIVGNNWMFTIVNITGQWKGDTIFAYPDLTLKIDDEKETIYSGDNMTYTISCENLGQAEAKDVQLNVQLPAQLQYVSGDNLTMKIDSLGAGEKKSFNITVTADQNINESVNVQTSATISTVTKEPELSNNTASTMSSIFPPQSYLSEVHSELHLSRNNSTSGSTVKGNLITNSIYVKNSGSDTLYDVEVTDVIKDPNGNIIGQYTWPLGTIKKNKTLLIQYQLLVGRNIQSGEYSYQASGISRNSLNKKIKSNKVIATLKVFASLAFSQASNAVEELTNIPTAEASENDNLEKVLGAESENTSRNFSLWILFAIVVSISGRFGWLKYKKAGLG